LEARRHRQFLPVLQQRHRLIRLVWVRWLERRSPWTLGLQWQAWLLALDDPLTIGRRSAETPIEFDWRISRR
jgi:hypothetical protein